MGCGGGLGQVRPFFREIPLFLLSGKVEEYKDADLLIVRKDCRHFKIETHRGNPTYEKLIVIEVGMMRRTFSHLPFVLQSTVRIKSIQHLPFTLFVEFLQRVRHLYAVSRFVPHAFSKRRNKACRLQEGPLYGVDHYSVKSKKTNSYQLIMCLCYNMCP